jgi:hypothetical protein
LRVAERSRHAAPIGSIGNVGYLAGGAVLFASAFVNWVARGTGSGLRGHALVDAVVALGRDVPALSNGRLTVLWYLVPASGAASWIACGLRGHDSRVSRALAGGALVVTLLVAAAFVRLVGVARLGWGPKLAVAGAAVLCLAAWLPWFSGARPAAASEIETRRF